MPEAPNNRFWPAAVMTASMHLAAPIGGIARSIETMMITRRSLVRLAFRLPDGDSERS